MKGWVKKGKGGFVVVLALIALMAMSFFLMTGAATTTSSVKVSGNYTKTVDVFDIAEVGVARGRKLMEGKTFDQLLALYPSGVMISKTPFNGGNYEVRIRDNDIDDQGAPNPKENGNPATDADNLLVLTSYGYGKSGGSVQIETHQQIMTGITFPPSPGMPGSGQGPTGALLCGTTTDAKTSGGGEITGHDYNIPPELMDSDPTTWCTGTGCDGSDQTPTSGGGYAVAGESAVNTTGSGFESNLTPEVLANTGANSHCSDWRAIRDQLATLSPSAPGVRVLTDADSPVTAPLNDCTNPQVFIINTTGSRFDFSGSATLCGIVVVASNTSIRATGTVTIVGLILVMGTTASLQFEADVGTPNIFGQVIVESTAVDTQKELDLRGSAQLAYSQQGIGFAQQAMTQAGGGGGGGGGGGALLTVAWEEKY